MLTALGAPAPPPRNKTDDAAVEALQTENNRLKLRVNKLIDEVKELRTQLESKKKELGTTKKLLAARKNGETAQANTMTTTLSGKKRPASAEGEISVQQGPVSKAGEPVPVIYNQTSSHGPMVQEVKGVDDSSRLLLLDTYKSRYFH